MTVTGEAPLIDAWDEDALILGFADQRADRDGEDEGGHARRDERRAMKLFRHGSIRRKLTRIVMASSCAALLLACTLAAAVLFQPVLMGPPREISD